ASVRMRPFPAAGLDVVLFGEGRGELGGSEYLKTIHGIVRGVPPALDLARERALHRLLVELAAADLIRSAHDCAEGGVAATLAECCFENGGIGADVNIAFPTDDGGVDRVAATLFGESATRVIVSADPASTARVLEAAKAAGIPAAAIGTTGGARLRIALDGDLVIDCAVADAETVWRTSLATRLTSRVE
ncbi:MAG TPA: AIR synthase-related protein, partial [Vicinamibacterales bacterium]|nr:AIR synthase-related protein [Vicinamibacterales bacterium]